MSALHALREVGGVVRAGEKGREKGVGPLRRA